MIVNFNRNIRTLILGVFLGASLSWVGSAAAQERNAALQENDKALTSIEGMFSQIEGAKTDEEKDKYADNFERSLASYAKAMMSSFDAALKQAELAAKSQGKEGNSEQLKAFEDLAVKHEKKLNDLDRQAKKAKPKSGSIWVPGMDGKLALGLLEKIGDALISPAEAAIALSVYSACHRSPPNQTACAQGIAAGLAQSSAANAAFNSCWDSYANRRPNWWRALLRTGCVATLVARLA
jgi:hypothetical protein